MSEVKFPRTLYKKDGPETLVSAKVKYSYSKELVNNETEYKAALKAGYVDDFSIVTSEEVPEEVKEPEVEEDSEEASEPDEFGTDEF